ncbi:reverse transcriptase [Trichonephila clavipes]|nr:reverse transcriptase [Trichonephila clavipes]
MARDMLKFLSSPGCKEWRVLELQIYCHDPKNEEFWKTKGEALATVDPMPRHLDRAEAFVRFRLHTGHDFLGVYLHWLDVAANEACPICDYARMEGDHLL